MARENQGRAQKGAGPGPHEGQYASQLTRGLERKVLPRSAAEAQ